MCLASVLFDCRGFWRLLVVREGRSSTFLPLPAVNSYGVQPASAAAGGDKQQQRHQRLGKLPSTPVLPPTPLEQVPVERWVVRNPLATQLGQAPAAGTDGIPLSEVRRRVVDGEGKGGLSHPLTALMERGMYKPTVSTPYCLVTWE